MSQVRVVSVLCVCMLSLADGCSRSATKVTVESELQSAFGITIGNSTRISFIEEGQSRGYWYALRLRGSPARVLRNGQPIDVIRDSSCVAAWNDRDFVRSSPSLALPGSSGECASFDKLSGGRSLKAEVIFANNRADAVVMFVEQ